MFEARQPKACLLLFTAQLSQRLFLKHTVKKTKGNPPLWASQDMLVFAQQWSVERGTLS